MENIKNYKEDVSFKNKLDNYTPCRISECFLDCDGEIEITNFTGVFKLKSVGRLVWLMCDGKNTISDIVSSICHTYNLNEPDQVKKQVINLLKNLNQRKAIIVNWDPLYKFELSQVLEDGK